MRTSRTDVMGSTAYYETVRSPSDTLVKSRAKMLESKPDHILGAGKSSDSVKSGAFQAWVNNVVVEASSAYWTYTLQGFQITGLIGNVFFEDTATMQRADKIIQQMIIDNPTQLENR